MENGVAWKTQYLDVRIPAVGETTQFDGTNGWDPAIRDMIIKVEERLAAEGAKRKGAVKAITDCTAAPPTESTGDRYILDSTTGSVHADWDGAAKLDIVEFDGDTWVAATPEEGWVCLVDDEDRDAVYLDDGTPSWRLRPRGFNTDSVVWVEAGGTPVLNGVNLLAAYAEAKTLTPGGNALSEGNRAVVFIPPGTYDLAGSTLNVDGEFVDIVGMDSGYGTTDASVRSPVTITGTVSQLNVTVRDARLSNFGLHGQTADTFCMTIDNPTYYADRVTFDRIIFTGDDPDCWAVWSATVKRIDSLFRDCHAVNGFLVGGEFRGEVHRCVANDGSFAGWVDGPTYAEPCAFNGKAYDCVSGSFSFGSNNASERGDFGLLAVARRCTAGGNSFGFSNGDRGWFRGSAHDCHSQGQYSFAASHTKDADFVGTVKRCTSSERSFCYTGSSGNTASFDGNAWDCSGGQYSFGSSDQSPYTNCEITAGSLLVRCVGETRSFAGSGDMYGELRDCEYRTSGTEQGFGSVRSPGKLIRCSQNDGGSIKLANGSLISCRFRVDVGSPVDLIMDGGHIEDCGLYSGDASDSITSGASRNVNMTHSRMNTAINANVTNNISIGYNVVDSNYSI
jgi:hypothetical protein